MFPLSEQLHNDPPSPRLTRSLYISASDRDEFDVPVNWVRENAPVPTLRRPAVRIASDIDDLTKLIASDDYASASTSDKNIVVSNVARKTNAVRYRKKRNTERKSSKKKKRLEPSGKVVTVKGEKQKIKKKDETGTESKSSGSKIKQKKSISSSNLSPARMRSLSLESENEVFSSIRYNLQLQTWCLCF